jgi:hypothetical protein
MLRAQILRHIDSRLGENGAGGSRYVVVLMSVSDGISMQGDLLLLA